MMRRLTKAVAAVLLTAPFLVAPPANAGCDQVWLICGQASSACTLFVEFELGTPTCTARGNYVTSSGDHPDVICEALLADLEGDCGDCDYECTPVRTNCYALGEVTNCEPCELGGHADGCSITITAVP